MADLSKYFKNKRALNSLFSKFCSVMYKPQDQITLSIISSIFNLFQNSDPVEDILLSKQISDKLCKINILYNLSDQKNIVKSHSFCMNIISLLSQLNKTSCFQKFASLEKRAIFDFLSYKVIHDIKHLQLALSVFPDFKISPTKIYRKSDQFAKDLINNNIMSEAEIIRVFTKYPYYDSTRLLHIVDFDKNNKLFHKMIKKLKPYSDLSHPERYETSDKAIQFLNKTKQYPDMLLDLSKAVAKYHYKNCNFSPFLKCLKDLDENQISKIVKTMIIESNSNEFLLQGVLKIFPNYSYLVALT